jgi:CheY-like chemotaxis protein
VEHAFEAGMNGHLAKPIEIEEVLKTMNKWLSPA